MLNTTRLNMSVKEKDKRESWKNSHPCIKEWLENLKPKSQYQYLFYSYKYFKWIETQAPEPYRGKTPEQLLDLQDASGKVSLRETFKQVKLLKKWLRDVNAAYKTKMLMKTTIYSFYGHNYVPLPKDLNFNVHADRASVNGYLTIEELKKIILSSNELYQAVFMVRFQSAMGDAELLYFNTHSWSQVKKQLEQGKQHIRVDLVGRKHRSLKPSGNYFTFIGKDGVTKLKDYLKYRAKLVKGKEHAPSLNEAIFINEKLKPLRSQDSSGYFKRHAFRLGIIKKIYKDDRARYRVHTHEMRDVFRTEWNLTDAKPFMAEFFMGHAIDSNRYNKIMQRPEWAEEQYCLAEPYLNILSEDPRTIKREDINTLVEQRVKERVKTLETEIGELRRAKETFALNGQQKTSELEELKRDMVNIKGSFQELKRMLQELKEA